MAERRMFAKTIIDSDAFLDMPLSTQALYFHLSMRADDDGFINNPKKIQRMIGAADDDLKVLITKKFIIPFESGIVVIKHWKIHNYIQKDRYKETVYLEEKAMLEVKDNKGYTLLDTPCIHDVYISDTQVRLGKDSIELGKDSIEEEKKDNMLEAKAPSTYIIDLPTNRFNTIKENYYVSQELYQLLVDTYSNANVMEELKKMKAWLITNASKRKTLKGMEKFINSWLSKEHDKRKSTVNFQKKGDGWDYINDEFNKIKMICFRRTIWTERKL